MSEAGRGASTRESDMDAPSNQEGPAGAQDKSVELLQKWQQLSFGMFVHFGMNTFVGSETVKGDPPSDLYAPTDLDVAQWVRVVQEAGARYAVLTAKHLSGHCLWPSKYTDYSVATTSDQTDVVRAFVDECRAHGIKPGLYYCSWDDHHTFGGATPNRVHWWESFVTPEYMEFMSNQIEELLSNYGPLVELWVDIPHILPRHFRHQLAARVQALAPETVFVMNNPTHHGYPSDVRTYERTVPGSEETTYIPGRSEKFDPWEEINGEKHYRPAEVCTTVCQQWFHEEGDVPRDDRELLALYLQCKSRGVNLLLDIAPDRTGQIPEGTIAAMRRLRKNLDLLAVD